MSLSEQEVVAAVGEISPRRLRVLVRRGWVRPRRSGGTPQFTDADVARVRLVCQLTETLDVTDDDVPVILSLLDQVHGLRRVLRNLGRAVEGQPDEVRTQIAQAFRELHSNN